MSPNVHEYYTVDILEKKSGKLHGCCFMFERGKHISSLLILINLTFVVYPTLNIFNDCHFENTQYNGIFSTRLKNETLKKCMFEFRTQYKIYFMSYNFNFNF